MLSKIPVDKVFMHYFEKMPSASGGFYPRSPLGCGGEGKGKREGRGRGGMRRGQGGPQATDWPQNYFPGAGAETTSWGVTLIVLSYMVIQQTNRCKLNVCFHHQKTMLFGRQFNVRTHSSTT